MQRDERCRSQRSPKKLTRSRTLLRGSGSNPEGSFSLS